MSLPVLRAIDDGNFDAAIAAPGVTLVHFTATWCQPCTRAGEFVAALSIDLRRRAVVLSADIDAAPHAAHRADVRGVPCLVAFRDGSRVASKMGQFPAEKLRAWADEILKGEK